ncbi:MAG: serine hydrolase [Verrucomicrobiota bacterium]
MRNIPGLSSLFVPLLFGSVLPVLSAPSNGLAPEVTSLNLKDKLYQLEAKLPDLEAPFISVSPEAKKDGVVVGALGVDGGNHELIERYAMELAGPSKDPKAGNTDSLLISYKGKLIVEAYYRRGRANFPHYQMSITKSYTALALGRAIQLGHLKLEDIDKPVVSFLKKLDLSKLVPGAEKITVAEALQMTSGIRLGDDQSKALTKDVGQLKGLGEVQAYLQHSAPIPPSPREMKYQESDPALVMQVLDAVVPGGAEAFIANELLAPLAITQYHWETGVSGLPKSAAGSSILSRDMVKFGNLILNKGQLQGQAFIPEAYLTRATTAFTKQARGDGYGFFWWSEDVTVNGKSYHLIEGRGAGGQFIITIPELDLVTVVTSHNQGMGDTLKMLPERIIPAFAKK